LKVLKTIKIKIYQREKKTFCDSYSYSKLRLRVSTTIETFTKLVAKIAHNATFEDSFAVVGQMIVYMKLSAL